MSPLSEGLVAKCNTLRSAFTTLDVDLLVFQEARLTAQLEKIDERLFNLRVEEVARKIRLAAIDAKIAEIKKQREEKRAAFNQTLEDFFAATY